MDQRKGNESDTVIEDLWNLSQTGLLKKSTFIIHLHVPLVLKKAINALIPFRNARNMPRDNCLELPPKGIVGSEVGSAEGLVRDIGSGS